MSIAHITYTIAHWANSTVHKILNLKGIYAILSRISKCRKSRILVLIFWVKKLVGANFLRFCNSAAWADWHSKVNQEIGQNTNIILMHGSLSGALDHEDWGFSLRTPSSQTQFIKIFSSKWQVMQRNFKVVSLITSPLLPLRHKTMICCFLRTLCVVLLFQNCLHQSCSFLILLTSSAPPPLLSPE